MDVQLENLAKNKVRLSIKDGDIGVLYLIQHELLKNSNPEFAGVIIRHPLTNELWMRVDSKSPIKDISKAIVLSQENVRQWEKTSGAVSFL